MHNVCSFDCAAMHGMMVMRYMREGSGPMHRGGPWLNLRQTQQTPAASCRGR